MEAQPQAQPRPAQSQGNLIRAEQVPRLPHLSEQQKAQTQNRIHKLWEILNSTPQNDPKYQQAYQHLAATSAQLMQGMKAFMNRSRAPGEQQRVQTQPTQQQQGGQQQGQQQSQPQGQQQPEQQSQQPQPPQQQTPQAQSTQQPQQQQQQQSQSQPQPQQQQTQPNQMPQQPPASQQAQQNQAGQPAPQSQPNGANLQVQTGNNPIQFSQLSQEVQNKVNAQHFFFPPLMVEGTRQAEDWLREAKARFGHALQRMRVAQAKKNELQRVFAVRQSQGAALSPEEQNNLNSRLQHCNKMMGESQTFMEKFKEQQEQFRKQQTQHRFSNQPGAPAPSGHEGPDAAAATGGPSVTNNVQGPQAHTISTAQAAARATVTGSAGSPTAANPTQPGALQATSSSAQQTPVDATTTQPFTSQSAMNNTPGGISRPSTATGQPAGVHPGGLQTTHAHPSQTPSLPLNTVNGGSRQAVPITKNLQVQEPKPVAMPPARPTLNGGAGVGLPGQLAQPALTALPGYVLEQSEDGHLLSKKKLNELVREVMGPGSEDQLSPEAEEVCLQVVDDFIDDVTTAACRLAKLRGASCLEPRDIQVILERQYNIRIPGFSTDEVRTVRKAQPTPGWAHKMSAIQAAKLTGGGNTVALASSGPGANNHAAALASGGATGNASTNGAVNGTATTSANAGPTTNGTKE